MPFKDTLDVNDHIEQALEALALLLSPVSGEDNTVALFLIFSTSRRMFFFCEVGLRKRPRDGGGLTATIGNPARGILQPIISIHLYLAR